MQIILITAEDVYLEDIERAFQDHRSRAIEQKKSNYLEATIYQASNCIIDDKHIISIKKIERGDLNANR